MATASSEKKNQGIVNFISGGFGACAAKTMMAPMSRAVVLYQLGGYESKRLSCLFREISVKEGASGLWKGNTAMIMQRFPASGTQLFLYDYVKHAIKAFTNTTDESSMATKAAAGGIAATMASVGVYPLEVVRTKMMSGNGNYNTIGGTMKHVWRNQGAAGFYAGLGPTLVQRVPEITINYAVYETTKAHIADTMQMGQAPGIVVGGAAAALVAVAACFPIDIVKRRMQMNRDKAGAERYKNSFDCVAKMYRANGVRGFYMGAGVECMKVVPQVIAMWGLIEAFRRGLAPLFE